MLRWPIRVASVIALTVLAYGWGDWWRERPLLDGILLALLSVVLLIAVARLYRPGGLAAFPDTSGRAPGEPIPAPHDQRERRAARAPEPATRTAVGDVGPPPSRERGSGGSLWSERSTRAAPAMPAGGARAAGDPVDLNSATADELARLPGIGRGAAERVVSHRDARGPFGSVEALAEVEGFDAARVARVAGRLRV